MWSEFDSEGKKVCTKCGERQHKDQFYRRSHGVRVKHMARCKTCFKVYHVNKPPKVDQKEAKLEAEFGNLNQYLRVKLR
jgi:hypothetical protein